VFINEFLAGRKYDFQALGVKVILAFDALRNSELGSFLSIHRSL